MMGLFGTKNLGFKEVQLHAASVPSSPSSNAIHVVATTMERLQELTSITFAPMINAFDFRYIVNYQFNFSPKYVSYSQYIFIREYISIFQYIHSQDPVHYEYADLRQIVPEALHKLLSFLPFTSCHLFCIDTTCRIFTWEKSISPKHLMTFSIQIWENFLGTFWINADLLTWIIQVYFMLLVIDFLCKKILEEALMMLTWVTSAAVWLGSWAVAAGGLVLPPLEALLTGAVTCLQKQVCYNLQTMSTMACWRLKSLKPFIGSLCRAISRIVKRMLCDLRNRLATSSTRLSNKAIFERLEAKYASRQIALPEAHITQGKPSESTSPIIPVTEGKRDVTRDDSDADTSPLAEEVKMGHTANEPSVSGHVGVQINIQGEPIQQQEEYEEPIQSDRHDYRGSAEMKAPTKGAQRTEECQDGNNLNGEKADHTNDSVNSENASTTDPYRSAGNEIPQTTNSDPDYHGAFRSAGRQNNMRRAGRGHFKPDMPSSVSAKAAEPDFSFNSAEEPANFAADDHSQPRTDPFTSDSENGFGSSSNRGRSQSPDFWKNPAAYMSYKRNREQKAKEETTEKQNSTSHTSRPKVHETINKDDGRFYFTYRGQQQQQPQQQEHPQQASGDSAYTKPQYQSQPPTGKSEKQNRPRSAYTKPQYQPQPQPSQPQAPPHQEQQYQPFNDSRPRPTPDEHHPPPPPPPPAPQSPPPTPTSNPPTRLDPYALLSLPRTATPSAIRTAYRGLALQRHPDKLAPPTSSTASQQRAANEAFQALHRAFEILSDDVLRVVLHLEGVEATADHGVVEVYEKVWGPYRGGEMLRGLFERGEVERGFFARGTWS